MYSFGPNADFEGQLVGAMQRLESGGTLRVIDALFVQSDAGTGELVAIDLEGRAAGALVRLLDFRLDARKRRTATGTARALGETLEPGAAIAAVLVEHVWARSLGDAVARTGATSLLDVFVEASALAQLTSELVTAAQPRGAEAETG